MPDPTEVLQAQLALLRQEYGRTLLEKIRAVEENWQALLAGPWDHATLVLVQRQIHNLAGSGATFGFRALSGIACKLELYLQAIGTQEGQPSPEQRANVARSLATLSQAAQTGPDEGLTRHMLTLPPPPPSVREENKLILLLETSRQVIEEVTWQLERVGYTVQVFTELAGLITAARQVTPAALVLDLLLTGGGLAGNTIATLQQGRAAPVPVIFLSARSVLGAHLQAVRAGGNAYLSTPVDGEALIDKLDQLTTPPTNDPYRILVVDDEPIVAKYHASLLQAAGMVTHVVYDPMQVMAPLSEFKPDLILMDLYMLGCTGLELAEMIRQQEAYIGIPIVFLSGELNTSRQLMAMQHGGDDFLTKPIQPDHLVSAVRSRVQRLRTLRALMLRDSLTGLLNHASIKEQLQLEILRARRQGTALAFALIDLDHFKTVNDTYGHPTGDRVIKALARLLRQRLRSTDLVGRYGGEELAIIFSNTRAQDALNVLDELRRRWAQLTHHGEGGEFTVTFSGGVVAASPETDALYLIDAADRALYRAKAAGRDCLILSDAQSDEPAPPAPAGWIPTAQGEFPHRRQVDALVPTRA